MNLKSPLRRTNIAQNFRNFIKKFKKTNQYVLIQVELEISDKNIQILCEKVHIDLYNETDLNYVKKSILDNISKISKNKIVKANRIIIEYVIINEKHYNEINNELVLKQISD